MTSPDLWDILSLQCIKYKTDVHEIAWFTPEKARGKISGTSFSTKDSHGLRKMTGERAAQEIVNHGMKIQSPELWDALMEKRNLMGNRVMPEAVFLLPLEETKGKIRFMLFDEMQQHVP